MKLVRLRIIKSILLISLVYISFVTSTNTQTNMQTNSKAKTESKTSTLATTMVKTNSQMKTQSSAKAMTSIFSYDFLSIMKKKMELMKEKASLGNKSGKSSSTKATYTTKFPKPGAEEEPGQAPTPAATPTPASPEPEPQEEPMGQIKIGDGPIFFAGWVKYFKFSESEAQEKPNAFFKNNYFFEQLKLHPQADTSKKGSDGQYIYVPDESHFYATLFKDSLTITSNRYNNTARVFDNLYLDKIQPVVEGSGYSGGIIDFGAFSEGSCFKLALVTHKTWIICTDNNDDKSKLMISIKNIKLLHQREKGEILISEPEKKEESLENIMGDKKEETDKGTDKNPKDGHWMLLQDWSQCSKKCDKGVSTLHRLCIPPQHGGKPCEGEAILTRECNPEPCPSFPGEGSNNSTKLQKLAKPVTLKPIVKVMPYSNKPQRYHKCIIKESDLMMTRDFEQNNEDNNESARKKKIHSVQVPVRAVLNNRTLTFYENAEDFSSHFITFNLRSADFSHSKKRGCFIISDGHKRAELCPFMCDGKDNTYNEWDEAFHTFKFNCKTPADTVDFDLEGKLAEKMKDAKSNLLLEREEEVKKKVQEKDEQNSNNIIKETSQVAQQAIMKEENLEELIEKEEQEKEVQEEKTIEQEIESEKKKNDCVMHAIKERELENQYQLKNKEREKEVDVIKQRAMEEVTKKRNKLKEKIAEMRKKAKRRASQLKQKLMSIRMSMAKEMTDVYKDGDQNKCMMAMKDNQYRINYCTANFQDYIKFSQCKENDDFCILCCETEFGEMHMEHRNQCIKDVCEGEKEKIEEEEKGKWIWIGQLDVAGNDSHDRKKK